MAVDVLAKSKPSMKEPVQPESDIAPVLGTQPETEPRPPITEAPIIENEPATPVIQTEEAGGSGIVDTMGGGGAAGRDNYYATQAPLVSSWESNAERMAEGQFKVDVNKAKQTLLRSRQQMQDEGMKGQTELALGEYERGQSAEKAGWTGGYMLDQKRQGDYLKASIQAQMYGAQELQKYGMDTQLEAARLSYDLGKENLAYKLYQDAQQMAITEAQMFGYYVSPEIRDLLNQRTAAQTVLSDTNSTEAERQRAQQILTQVDTWFGEQNLDPNDITTFGRITMEREAQNQAKLDAVLASIGDDPSVFLARNADGSYMTDPATQQYVKLNFADISKEDLYNFLNKDDNSELKFADSAFKSYARFLGQSSIAAYMATLGEDKEPTQAGFATFIAQEGNDKLAAYFESLGLTTEEAQAIIGDTFTASLTSDGKTISYGFNATTPGQVEIPEAEETYEIDQDEPYTVLTDFVNPITNEAMDVTDWLSKYDSYNNASSLGSLNAVQVAEIYKEDYDFYNSLDSRDSVSNLSFTEWSERLHRSHNTFSDKSYSDFLSGAISSFLEKETGVKGFTAKFNVLAKAPYQATIQIPSSAVTTAQEATLISMGFRKENNRFILDSSVIQGQDYSFKTYRNGSGWNEKYGGDSMDTNALSKMFYWLMSGQKQNTTEGEGRF